MPRDETEDTISVADARQIINDGVAAATKHHNAALSKKAMEIRALQKEAHDLEQQLKKAQAGEESSADPLLQRELQRVRGALETAKQESVKDKSALDALRKKMTKKTEESKKLNQELKKLKAASKNPGTKTSDDMELHKRALDKCSKELHDCRVQLKAYVDEENSVKTRAATSGKAHETSRKALEASKQENTRLTKLLKKAQQDLKRQEAQASQLAQHQDTTTSSQPRGSSSKSAAAVKKLKETVRLRDATIQELTKERDDLTKKLQAAYEVMKKSNKTIKGEQNKQVLQAARVYVREVVFRTTKLVTKHSAAECRRFTKKVYDGIKKEVGFDGKKDSPDFLSYEDFHRIYLGELLYYLSSLRSTLQTRLQNCVLGTSSQLLQNPLVKCN
jgi:DNA repair exonuclease SbcCD ATPase subunit